jgi:hypothetical protein
MLKNAWPAARTSKQLPKLDITRKGLFLKRQRLGLE